MNRNRISSIIRSKNVDDHIEVFGWVKSKRSFGQRIFIDINDGSSIKNLQILLESGHHSIDSKIIENISTGCSLYAEGILKESQGKQHRFDLQPSVIKVLGESDPKTYPIQKKRIGFERLRENDLLHFRAKTNTIGAVLRVRNACAYAVHQFFQERGFQWIHTPIITSNDCEGAGDLFTVTSLNLKKLPTLLNGDVDFSQDFFGKQTFLTVSGQLHAEILAMTLKDVYTFGPTFRAENSNTSRHLAEFWMIEPEMAFCNAIENQNIAESFLKFIFKFVLENCSDDLDFFQQRINQSIIQNAEDIITKDFERVSYTEAIKILNNSGNIFEYEVKWGKDLQSEHERYLAEEYFKKPVIVTDYPAEIKAFYMRLNDDERTVAAMDVLLPGIGEIIGGSQREERLDVLQQRINSSNIPIDSLSWYIDLRRFGTVEHSGFGLGFERILRFMTGMENIRDVIPFPRTPLNANL